MVLVHGVVASSRYMVPAALDLSRSCTVYAPDLPGYGHSSKPPYTLDVSQHADVVAAWASTLDLGRPIHVGNSFGCQIVVELAVRHPASIDRAVLLGPTVDPAARSWLQQVAGLAHDGIFEQISLWPTLALDLLNMGPVRAVRTVRAMLADRMEDRLPYVRVPTLVVRGSRDPIARQRWVEEVVRLLPQGQLAVLPGAPHAANYSAADQLVEVIEPFILGG